MTYSKSFTTARKKFHGMISKSTNEIDLSHAINTQEWLERLHGSSDEIVTLAAFAHDIERALPDRMNLEDFEDYNSYKSAHAKRGGLIAEEIALSSGYSKKDAARLRDLITNAEFSSTDPDVQKVCDADSISFFDNNLEYYGAKNSLERTRKKAEFMYGRASDRAKQAIDKILSTSD